MRANIRIGDIDLLFIYQYNDYFGNELDKYSINDLSPNHHTLEVVVNETIVPIDGNDKFIYKNRVKIKKDEMNYIVTSNPDGSVKHLISYDDKYNHIKIVLNKKLDKRLAEYEYVLSGMMFFEIALTNSYLAIHASAMSINDKAVLLSGPSGSGKSTQTEYFKEVFIENQIINEDKPLVYEKENKLYVCGSPWSGKNVLNQNLKVELTHILFVNKAEETKLVDLTHKEKIKQLMRNIHRPGYEENINHMVYLVERIIESVQIYRFNCVNNKSSSEYLKKYMEATYEN